MKKLSLLLTFVFITSCAIFDRRSRNSNSYSNSSYSKGKNIRKRRKPIFSPIRKKLALLPFFNESPVGQNDLAATATAEFRREIGKSGAFLIDPTGAEVFGTSKEVYAGGGVKLSEMARKGRLSGINLVVYGRITEARIRQKTDEIGFMRNTKSMSESIVEIKVFDISANKEIYSGRYDGNTEDKAMRFFVDDKQENMRLRRNLLRYSVRVAVRKFIPKLMKLGQKLDWTGRVAKILGSKIYINSGRQSGLHVGDILKVITEGSEIYDPESGALIGVSQGETKGTLEILDFFGPDGSVAILHSGGAVTEGDFVQLY